MNNLKDALDLAQEREHSSGGLRHYVVRTTTGYQVTDRPPYLGEWYTVDGIRHG